MLTRLVARASDQWTLMVFNESAVIIHCRMRYARIYYFHFVRLTFTQKTTFEVVAVIDLLYAACTAVNKPLN